MLLVLRKENKQKEKGEKSIPVAGLLTRTGCVQHFSSHPHARPKDCECRSLPKSSAAGSGEQGG